MKRTRPLRQLPDGKAGDIILVTSPHLPSLREVWLWLRQGCPRDYPVILRRGTIVSHVDADWNGDSAEIPNDDITVSNWSFGHAFQPAGMVTMSDLIPPLMARYGVTVQWPDGRCRHYRPTVLPEDAR